MATKEDDFSFPTTTNPPPKFIESPPLWRTASFPASYPGSPTREDGGPKGLLPKEDNCCASKSWSQRRSFSQLDDCKKMMMTMTKSPRDDDDDDHEEKMDMLWEDFNDEFSSSRKTKSSIISDSDDHGPMSPKGMVNMGCVQPLQLAKASKKPSLVVIMKVLKKIFLLQNSHRSIKNTTQW